ncbi:MAG: sugar transferase [Gammaproteobacteria bacterium]|nr:sugar transferase [Gammaproteobacteria bacterium]
MATTRRRLGYSHSGNTATKVGNIFGAVMSTVFFAPLMFVAYVLVRADGGPAIVRHERVRGGGTSFMAWRFRTHRQAVEAVGGHPSFASTEPELSAVGSILSRTRIEVMPLLYNVIRGDLTLSEMMDEV